MANFLAFLIIASGLTCAVSLLVWIFSDGFGNAKLVMYLAFVVMFLAIMTLDATGKYLAGQGDALRAARGWAERRPGSLVECQGRDTDDNSYISCTITWKDRNAELQYDAIECGVNRWYQGWNVSGCRVVFARAR